VLAFEPDERDQLGPVVIAACIVLSGRGRTTPMSWDLVTVKCARGRVVSDHYPSNPKDIAGRAA
jgi:hypothetical protein